MKVISQFAAEKRGQGPAPTTRRVGAGSRARPLLPSASP